MAVNQDHKIPSLLPLLAPAQTGVRLTLTPAKHTGGFPFATTPAAGPLAHMLDASITCGSTEISSLVLLVQKDLYPSLSNGMDELTNALVDQLWQTSRKHHLEHGQNNVFVDLVDAKDHFEPLQALFYCRFAKVFFHPPCPHCGNELSLCTDDTLLGSFGLPLYSKSLVRFMYCPQCIRDSARATFYIKEYAGNESAKVLDGKALVRSWKLQVKNSPDSLLPCINCEQEQQCFGSSMAAVDNLVALSFYPFYMLAFKDLQVNLKDFVPLLGAGPVETADMARASAGRQVRCQALEARLKDRRLFISTEPARLWLEILHLKLCLLVEILQQVEAAGNTMPNGISPWSVESFWIRLGCQARGLPQLWQFDPVLVDTVAKPFTHRGTATINQAHRRQFQAAAWFYVLLANSTQGPAELMNALEKLDADSAARDKLSDPDKVSDWNQVFQPGQIFWKPRQIELGNFELSKWTHILGLGLNMLRSGIEEDSAEVFASILNELEQLNNEIRQRLLDIHPGPATAGTTEPEVDPNGQELAAILERIQKRWSATVPDQDGDWQQTIVLKPASDDQSDARAGGGTENRRINLEKTMVLDTSAAEAEPELDETVVLQPGAHIPQPGVSSPAEETDLEKTVVLGKTQGSQQPSDHNMAREDSGQTTGEQEDLEATVVLNPENGKGAK